MSQRDQNINDFYEKLHLLTPHGDQLVPYQVTAQWEPHEPHFSARKEAYGLEGGGYAEKES